MWPILFNTCNAFLMPKYFLISVLIICSSSIFAQTNNEFFQEGQIFGNSSSGYQFSMTQKKLDPLGDLMRNQGENIGLFNFPELEIVLPQKFHFKLGFQFGFMNAMDMDVNDYLINKYGPNFSIISSGSYLSRNSTSFQTTIGKHFRWKKLLLLPSCSIGLRTSGIGNYKYLITNTSSNEAHTFFLNFKDTSFAQKNSIVRFQYALNCKIYSHNKDKVLNFFMEPGFNYTNKSTDIIRFERSELDGISDLKNLDYRSGNLNLSLQLGVSMRLVKIKF
jgi:hypothetical protein